MKRNNKTTNPPHTRPITLEATAVPWTLCQPNPSASARHLTAIFHLPTTWNNHRNPKARRPRPLHDACRIPLPKKGAVLITGPSGAGKSTLLRKLRQHPDVTRPGRFHITAIPDPQLHFARDATPLDALVTRTTGRDNLHTLVMDATASLADAGLNEPHLMLTPISNLSDGQRHRFHIACALHNIRHHHNALRKRSRIPTRPRDQRYLVFLDELGTTLDDHAAAALARSLRRAIDRSTHDITLVATSNRPQSLSELQPDVSIRTHLHDARVHVVRHNTRKKRHATLHTA